MSQLLDDLLDVSRIARGHVELRRKWVDVVSIVGAAVDVARPLLEHKGHALALDLPREPLNLGADPVRLTQILSNLLTNAAKYTDRGGSIRVSARREGDHVTISVRDNGIGIPPAMVPRLFQLFAQAETALNRSEGGLGVGLALVKGFVQLHGGTVEARSEGPGTGSEFIVRLPVGSEPREERSAPGHAGASTSKRLRVLVADDNVDAAETCAMLLRLWDHEVEVAHTGRDALARAESFQPQVALIDIGMPQLNGYQVAEAIRAQPWGRRTRLVAVTGWGQDEDKQQAREAGFDHHVTKPVDPATLRPLLDSMC
jgi:CheY-like chemotaxis protein/two-component sensor histidine kinase